MPNFIPDGRVPIADAVVGLAKKVLSEKYFDATEEQQDKAIRPLRQALVDGSLVAVLMGDGYNILKILSSYWISDGVWNFAWASSKHTVFFGDINKCVEGQVFLDTGEYERISQKIMSASFARPAQERSEPLEACHSSLLSMANEVNVSPLLKFVLRAVRELEPTSRHTFTKADANYWFAKEWKNTEDIGERSDNIIDALANILLWPGRRGIDGSVEQKERREKLGFSAETGQWLKEKFPKKRQPTADGRPKPIRRRSPR